MTTYQTSGKEGFLNELANIVIKNHKKSLEKVKIVLPSGLACNQLQTIILSKIGAAILPQIISINEMTFESEEIFKIPSKHVGSITKLEEKIILAKIIFEYPDLNYNQVQSLRLSTSLANLFFELESHEIDLPELSKLPDLDKPEHWLKIYNFIDHTYSSWQKNIHSINKITKAEYQKKILESEVNWLKKDNSNILILAGIKIDNLITKNFVKEVSEMDNCDIILPPFPYNKLSKINQYTPQIFSLLPENKQVESVWISSFVDRLIVNHQSQDKAPDISYLEFNNVFQEAEYTALECRKLIEKNPNHSIAIIAHNQQMKQLYSFYLDKYQLSYGDQFGWDILTCPAISLILTITDLLYGKFKLSKLFAFLSHPLIQSDLSLTLKEAIRNNNRFANSMKTIKTILNKESIDLQDYFAKINKALSKTTRSNNFTALLKNSLLVTENVVTNIWQLFPESIAPLRELHGLNSLFVINDRQDFSDILKQALNGGRFFPKTLKNNITITKPSNVSLINYDLVIMGEMNEDVYPNLKNNNPWINQDLQQKLGLPSLKNKLNDSFYEFYLNLQNNKVLLTRSKTDITNKNTLPSQFILSLKKIMNEALKTQHIVQKTPPPSCTTDKHVRTTRFPNLLYATDIELLIKSPYNFYCKKILNLRKTEEISEKPSLADFGNFFHLVLEKYTKQYDAKQTDKPQKIRDIAEESLKENIAPENNKKIWQIRIDAMAEEIIDFDENQREDSLHTFSEIKGKIALNISNRNVEIAAIADRIEIKNNGALSIIDYKTGSIPSKSEVLSGLAPQMIVEAIIARSQGFKELATNSQNNTCYELVYIKINSKSPYITKTIINLNEKEVLSHQQGLISLLSHYVKENQYPIANCIAKYDDYKHLARRE
ncbi:MAG: hypothetical protein DGJ47_000124 [Rickettsiaceae bacterium]